ncbi:MAG TPA: hypothetical protein VJM33_15920, partial [Microthrixaceae bacterium]|nr:hypothetical protein [Microthrixaceae bacterium]
IIFMLECQARFTASILTEMRARGARRAEVTATAMGDYESALDEALDRTVWADACHSWYKNAAGRITNNWPRSTIRYWRWTKAPDLTAFEFGVPTGASIAGSPQVSSFARSSPHTR